jgi:hypothetical protein
MAHEANNSHHKWNMVYGKAEPWRWEAARTFSRKLRTEFTQNSEPSSYFQSHQSLGNVW